MKNSFIPVNNDFNKAMAFAPSLTQEFRDKNMIKQKPHYIETVNVIEGLQDQGWEIHSVCEQRGSNRKVSNHFVKLKHPDFTLSNKNSKEGIANILLSNSCNGNSPLDLFLGVYRLVCSNGLVQKTPYFEHSLKHNKSNIERVPQILAGVNDATQRVLHGFEKLKHKELSLDEMMKLANQASKLRFQSNEIDIAQLLNVNRSADKGNDLWSVYNRIQENLTRRNLLVDKQGRLLPGIEHDVRTDTRVNQELFRLVENFA